MGIDTKFIKSVISDVEGATSGHESKVDAWLDSGNYALNRVISGDYLKGLPFGRVVEVFGDPSTGKSLLIYHWIALVQKMGGIAILDDSEDTYSESFGNMLGIDNDNLILLSSLTVEEHFEKCFLGWKDSKGKEKPGLVDLIWEKDTKCPILVCLDSLALLSTRHEQEVRLEKVDMSKAKLVRAALRNSSKWMKERGNILHVISNHVTTKIGVVFGNPKTTPGGSGIPFSASVRLDLAYSGKIKDDNNPDKIIGVHSRVTAAKNKVSAPFKNCELDIIFDKGVDSHSGLLDSFLAEGLAKESDKRGYVTIGKDSVRKSEFADYVKTHSEILQPKLDVKPKIFEKNALLPEKDKV